jgi:hypothetical protein
VLCAGRGAGADAQLRPVPCLGWDVLLPTAPGPRYSAGVCHVLLGEAFYNETHSAWVSADRAIRWLCGFEVWAGGRRGDPCL